MTIYSATTIQAVIDMIDGITTSQANEQIEFGVVISRNRQAVAVNMKGKTEVAVKVAADGKMYTSETIVRSQAMFMSKLTAADVQTVLNDAVQIAANDGQHVNQHDQTIMSFADHIAGQVAINRFFDDVQVELTHEDHGVALVVSRGALKIRIATGLELSISIGGRRLSELTITADNGEEVNDYKTHQLDVLSKAVHNIASKAAPLFVTQGGIERRLWADRPQTTSELIQSVYGLSI